MIHLRYTRAVIIRLISTGRMKEAFIILYEHCRIMIAYSILKNKKYSEEIWNC